MGKEKSPPSPDMYVTGPRPVHAPGPQLAAMRITEEKTYEEGLTSPA